MVLHTIAREPAMIPDRDRPIPMRYLSAAITSLAVARCRASARSWVTKNGDGP